MLSLLADDTNKLKEFLHTKIEKRKKQIHPAHNPRFNHDLQLEIDCIEWTLKKLEVNKIPNDKLEGVIRAMIKDLEKGKDQAIGKKDQIQTTCGFRFKVFNGFNL
ncbi:hypothetical protein BH18THE2_BH18THE2_16340 [soil metagenome]